MVRRRLWFVLTMVLIRLTAGSLLAQDGFRVFPYLQHPAPDAMTVLWFSEGEAPGQLSWKKEGSSSESFHNSEPAVAETLAYTTWEDTSFFNGAAPSPPYKHRIRLAGLDPGTVYEYSVTQGEEIFSASFRTAPAGNDTIRFMVYSDSETEPESTGNPTVWVDPLTGIWRSYLWDQTTGYGNNINVIRSRDPDLVLIAGDLVQHGGEQRDWDEFWLHNTDSAGQNSLAGRVPLITAAGNHEYFEGTYLDQYNQPGSERAMQRFLTYFETPSNGSSNQEQEGRYYSLRYGPAMFIVLDVNNNGTNSSMEDTNFSLHGEKDAGGGNAPDFGVNSRQYDWLVEELAKAQDSSLFTFLIFHHTPYSSGPHGFPAGTDAGSDILSGVPVRVLTPLFMQYGVDAVFSGHDELWERSLVSGTELQPDGTITDHSIHFYDVGTGGDGLRAPVEGTGNSYQEFLVHADVPEIWEDGILLNGGKHYGHLEVDIQPAGDAAWQAILKPVYVFPVYSKEDSAYTAFERRIYDDVVILTRHDTRTSAPDPDRYSSFLVTRVYPNPFNDQVTIEYYLDEPCGVTMQITDAWGRQVRSLQYDRASRGKHTIIWDGRDSGGNRLAEGIYVIRLASSTGLNLLNKALFMPR